MYRVRGTMDQRGSTVSGFIRIDRPGNTLPDRQRNCSACESAYSSGAGECALENAHQHGGYVGDVHENDDNGAQQIDGAHDGHNLFCHPSDGVFTADDEKQNKSGVNDAHGHDVKSEGGVQCLGDCVGAAALGELHEQADGEKYGQRAADFFALLTLDAALHVIHGAAHVFAVAVFSTVIKAQRNLSHFQHHAEKCPDEHPENGAGAAYSNRSSYAGNVAHTNGAAQTDAECPVRRNLAIAVFVVLGCFFEYRIF